VKNSIRLVIFPKKNDLMVPHGLGRQVDAAAKVDRVRKVVGGRKGREPVGSRGRVDTERIWDVGQSLLDVVNVVEVDSSVVSCGRCQRQRLVVYRFQPAMAYIA
jgi:hypothetical protein